MHQHSSTPELAQSHGISMENGEAIEGRTASAPPFVLSAGAPTPPDDDPGGKDPFQLQAEEDSAAAGPPEDPEQAAFQLKDEGESGLGQEEPEPFQLKSKNQTGMSDQLKSGVEQLSGHSMDDVRVHFNSEKPAQMKAHAYAQGSEIHLGPGQEKHLPHEAWHVAQQKQGRVSATKQFKGAGLNDDPGLEREADVMGAKALQAGKTEGGEPVQAKSSGWSAGAGTVQRVITEGKGKGEFFDDETGDDYCFIWQSSNLETSIFAKRSEMAILRGKILADSNNHYDLGIGGELSSEEETELLKWWLSGYQDKTFTLENSRESIEKLKSMSFIRVDPETETTVSGSELKHLLGYIVSTMYNVKIKVRGERGKKTVWGVNAPRQKGFGERAPRSDGQLFYNSDLISFAGVCENLDVKEADFKEGNKYENVKVFSKNTENYEKDRESRKDFLTEAFSQSELYFYVPLALREDKTDKGKGQFKIGGNVYGSLEEIDEAKELIKPSYDELVADRSVQDWKRVNRRGHRGGTQDAAMNDWNALGMAAYGKIVLGKSSLSVTTDHEWLHIQGVQNGGKNEIANLGTGTFVANSLMIPYENKIRSWGSEKNGHIEARYETATDPVNSPILKTITIKVAADSDHSIGPIPRSNPIEVKFDAQSGSLYDSFSNRVRMKGLGDQQKEKQSEAELVEALVLPVWTDYDLVTEKARILLGLNPARMGFVMTSLPSMGKDHLIEEFSIEEFLKMYNAMKRTDQETALNLLMEKGFDDVRRSFTLDELINFLDEMETSQLLRVWGLLPGTVKDNVFPHLSEGAKAVLPGGFGAASPSKRRKIVLPVRR